MKNYQRETKEMIANTRTYQFRVLAKGFTPFDTDSYVEALRDAETKAYFSAYVSILDDGEVVARWLGHRRVQVIG